MKNLSYRKRIPGNFFIILVGAFSIICTGIQASSIDKDNINLRDAIRATMENNPQLSSFHLRQVALQGEQKTAGLRPPLEFSADLENAYGDDQYKNTDSAELTLTLSKVIEMGGRRSARLDIANQQQQRLAAQKRILELDLLAQVTHRFINVLATQHRLALQTKAILRDEKTVLSIQQRVSVGRAPKSELSRARASLTQAKLAHKQAKRTLKTDRIKLASLWAKPEANFKSVNANLLKLDQPEPLDKLLIELEKNPDILIYANETRLREAELKLARSKRWPSFEPSMGFRQFEESDNSALVFGLSMPLFNQQRAKGAISKAKAEHLNVDVQRKAALLEMRAQMLGLYQQYEQAQDEVDALKNEVLPQLKQARYETQKAFNKGRYSYLDWKAVQNEEMAVELALINAAARAHQLHAEIERLSGRALTANNSGGEK